MLLQQEVSDVRANHSLISKEYHSEKVVSGKYTNVTFLLSMSDRFAVTSAQSYPVLSTEQHNEVPEQASRVPVQEVVVTRTLQGFVLGELYHIHLMGLLPEGQDTRCERGKQ